MPDNDPRERFYRLSREVSLYDAVQDVAKREIAATRRGTDVPLDAEDVPNSDADPSLSKTQIAEAKAVASNTLAPVERDIVAKIDELRTDLESLQKDVAALRRARAPKGGPS